MKFIYIIILVCSVLFLVDNGLAQQRRRMSPPEDGPRPERLEKFRKMRLVEVLDLNEEDAVRFFAKQAAHDDKMRDMMEIRNKLVDSLDRMLKEKGNEKNMQSMVDHMIDIDRRVYQERERYRDEIRKFLPAEKFARFMVFERNFNRQVRDAFREMQMKPRNRDRNND